MMNLLCAMRENFWKDSVLTAMVAVNSFIQKLDMVRNNIPRLRRVSMSPWVDVEEAAKGLEDKYIFSYKPNPAVIAAEKWNPDYVRQHLWDVLEKRGCIIEIIMKDTHTCRNQSERMWEWVRMAKEVAE